MQTWPKSEIEHDDASERPIGIGRHQRAFWACSMQTPQLWTCSPSLSHGEPESVAD
jgi:hypothetical protein